MNQEEEKQLKKKEKTNKKQQRCVKLAWLFTGPLGLPVFLSDLSWDYVF